MIGCRLWNFNRESMLILLSLKCNKCEGDAEGCIYPQTSEADKINTNYTSVQTSIEYKFYDWISSISNQELLKAYYNKAEKQN